MEKPIITNMEDRVKAVDDYHEKNFQWFFSQSENDTGMWQQELQALMDSRILKGLFFNDDWVYIVVDLVARKVSDQLMEVVKKKDNVYVVIPDHPVTERILYPNNHQDYHTWMYNHAADNTVLGNGYFWDLKKNKQILNVPGERMTNAFDDKGEFKGYILLDDNGQSTTQQISANQVIHSMRPNPSDIHYGLSPFIPGRKSLLFNRYAMEYITKFFSSPTPGMALEIDKDASERTALRMLRSFEMNHYGRKSQRRTMILPKGVKANTITPKLGDNELQNFIELNRETIINLLKIPKHELSIQKVGSLGSEEARMALRNFWAATLIPMMRNIAGTMTVHFRNTGELAAGEMLRFDLTTVEVLQDDRLKRAKLAAELINSGSHSPNEVRDDLYGKDPHPDGDGLGVVGSGSSMRIDANSSDRAREEDRPESSDGVNMSAKFISKHKDWWDSRTKNLENQTSIHSLQMEELVQRALGSIVSGALDVLSKMLRDDVKATRPPKILLKRSIIEATNEAGETYVKSSREVLLSTESFGYGVAFDVPFELGDLTGIDALRDDQTGDREKAVEFRQQFAFKQMQKTTVNSILETVDEGLATGKNVREVSLDIARKFENDGLSNTRARTIARTETLTAMSLGRAAAMKNVAKVVPGLKKAWISAQDGRVRNGINSDGNHAKLDGVTIDHDKKFKTVLGELLFPRDPNGKAADVINCRCDLVLLPPGQTLNDF